MLKKFAASFALCLCLVQFAFCGNPERATVTVVVSGALIQDGKIITFDGWGTGTAIGHKNDETLILTNKHVLKDAKKVWIIFNKKLVEGAIVFINNGDEDIACLKVPIILEKLELAKNEAATNQPVKHYGKASGPQEGRITGKLFSVRPPGVVMMEDTKTDMLSIVGDSGAAIVNLDNEIVALNWGRMGSVDKGSQLAVSLADIKQVLKSHVADWGF